MVNLARKMLLDDKLRFLITVTGVGFAVSLVCIQGGILLGLLDNASCTIDHASADLWVTARNAPNVDFANAFPQIRVQRVRSVPGVERADNLIVWFMQVALPSGAKESTQVYAMEDFRRWNLPWSVETGDLADLRRGRYVMLDQSAEKRFGPFQVGDYREFLNRRMKIIGRTREARSFTTTPLAFLDFQLAQSLMPQQLRDRTSYILVRLSPDADVEAVRAEIRRRLPYNDVYTKAAWASRSRNYWLTNTGLGFSMYMTVFLGCLVGVVVVAQTLYTSTMEHHKEFATVKAIGGSNGDIYKIIAEQALIAAVIGFAVGVSIAYALQMGLSRTDLKLIIPATYAVGVFFGTIVLCLAASALSFGKIASLDPAIVFRG
jgi:putative ABC transport system permease protein